MKLLILLTISIASFSIFSAELGEDQKSECIYADQSGRDAKPLIQSESESTKHPNGQGQSK